MGSRQQQHAAHFYVSGCSQDDVHIFSYNSTTQLWAEELVQNPSTQQMVPQLTLGHGTSGVGLGVYPCAAGITVSQTGQTMVVANYYNDSISILTGGYGNWALENVSPGSSPAVYKPRPAPRQEPSFVGGRAGSAGRRISVLGS